jgi:hypothetical protein
VVDISTARALGYQPTMDLDAGLATVWPEFDPDRDPGPPREVVFSAMATAPEA